jgi:hypothetical protein
LFLAALGFAACGGSSSNAAAQQLYRQLLRTPVVESELPAGFTQPRTGSLDPGTGPKSFGAVGAVAVDVHGPDSGNGIAYTVYPSAADARRGFDHRVPSASAAFHTTDTPTDFGYPAQCFNLTGTTNGQQYGATNCIVLVGNVEVAGTSAIAGSGDQGDVDVAAALARAGIGHLLLVQGAHTPTPPAALSPTAVR